MDDKLIALAEDLQFETAPYADGVRMRIPCSPIILRFEKVDNSTIYGAFYVRTTSWDWPGERSDLNDIISTLAAAFLAESGVASCTMLDVPHPAARVPEGEVYARYLILAQPTSGYFHMKDGTFPEAEKLIASVFHMEHFLHTVLPMHPDEEELEQEPDDAELATWVGRVTSALGAKVDPGEDTYNGRFMPPWSYYRNAKADISVVQSEHVSDAIDFLRLGTRSHREFLPGVSGELVIRGGLRNYVANDDLTYLDKILREVSNEPETAPPARVIPLENCLISARQETIVFMGSGSGLHFFEDEREKILRRHQREAAFLFAPTDFIWAQKMDGGRFESLVYDLLLREPGIKSVRTVGSPNEADGGRDLIAKWITPMQEGAGEVHEDSPLIREREVIVQCKALNRSVGRRQILDVRATLDMYDADGYLLAAAGSVTVGAIDYLIKLRSLGDYYTTWWSRQEIEHRLRQNPDIAARYQDLVTEIRPPENQ